MAILRRMRRGILEKEGETKEWTGITRITLMPSESGVASGVMDIKIGEDYFWTHEIHFDRHLPVLISTTEGGIEIPLEFAYPVTVVAQGWDSGWRGREFHCDKLYVHG